MDSSSPPGPRLPPLKALLAFEAAARHGSFAQGADELAVTPSAISHQIQLLEAFLGVQLFLRHAGRAALTQAGRIYAAEIAIAFGHISDATARVAPQSQHGNLVVASGPSFAAKWLQLRLPDFLARHPDIRIRLSTLDKDRLDADRYDLAITYGVPLAARASVEPLITERLCPLCSPALAMKLSLNAPADLLRATLIHSSNALTWSAYLRRVGVDDLRPAGELWLDRSMMAIEAATRGLGVVLESELLAREELRDGRLVAPFGAPSLAVEVTSYYLVRSPESRASGAAATFEAWLRRQIAEDAAPAA